VIGHDVQICVLRFRSLQLALNQKAKGV